MTEDEARSRQADAMRRGRMLEERAASQAIIRGGVARRAGRRAASGVSEIVTAVAVVVVVIGMLILVFNFAK